MENNPARGGSPLMKRETFQRNFRKECKDQTYLCYKMEVQDGDAWVPVEGLQGIRRKRNVGTYREHRHGRSCFVFVNNPRKGYPRAELCFLDLFQSWDLDEGKQYRLTWYISWSPYPDCAQKLVDFLRQNSHVQLRIFAARIYTRLDGYEDGLRRLRDAGARLAIMTFEELQHCWDTFVDNRGQPLEPETELEKNIQKLNDILRNQGN